MMKFNNNIRFKYHKSLTSCRTKYIFIVIFLLLLFALPFGTTIANSQSSDNYNIDDLYEETYSQIEDLDVSKLEDIIKDLGDDYVFVDGFKSVIKSIVDGEFDINADSLVGYIFNALTVNIRKLIPLCIFVIVIAVVIRCLNIFSPASFKDGIIEIINFIAIGVVVLLVGHYIISVNGVITRTISTMQNIIDVLFPIMLSLMGALGATSSVAIYTPITSIVNTTVSTIITNFLLPLYLVAFAIVILSHISSMLKINKLGDFIGSLFKSSFAFIFTLFSGIFAIKGISVSKYDSIGIHTTKFAIKNYIPIIGSYISEGFNYIMLSSVLVKNAIGLAGIIIILLSVLSPIIFLLVFRLLLQFTSAVTEMVGSSEISSLLSKLAKVLAYPIAIILGVAFMFIMTLALPMCTANLI